MAADQPRIKLPFLLACTDPRVGPVDEVILARENDHDPMSSTDLTDPSSKDVNEDTIDPDLLLLSFIDPAFTTDDESGSASPSSPAQAFDAILVTGHDAELQARIAGIEGALRVIAAVDTQTSTVLTTAAWTNFFSVKHFQECIEVFFQKAELLAMLVHRQSFKATQGDPHLLLAICVAGSAYLRHRRHNSDSLSFSRTILDLSERCIFDQVEQLSRSPDEPHRLEGLELCQAAYMIETLQSCVKDSNTRRRVVTRCHPMLVECLRRLRITGSRHAEVWPRHFTYTESCIRLLHWTWINDAWFTLLTNHPPAMTLMDMSGQFSCNDRLWRADSLDSFQDLLAHRDFDLRGPSLKDLMGHLLSENLPSDIDALFMSLEIKHLLVMILALQHVIYHYQTTVCTAESTTTLTRALDRWDKFWHNATHLFSETQLRQLGLARYSPEFALLFRKIVEHGGDENLPDYLRRGVTYDTNVLHQFIRQSCC